MENPIIHALCAIVHLPHAAQLVVVRPLARVTAGVQQTPAHS